MKKNNFSYIFKAFGTRFNPIHTCLVSIKSFIISCFTFINNLFKRVKNYFNLFINKYELSFILSSFFYVISIKIQKILNLNIDIFYNISFYFFISLVLFCYHAKIKYLLINIINKNVQIIYIFEEYLTFFDAKIVPVFFKIKYYYEHRKILFFLFFFFNGLSVGALVFNHPIIFYFISLIYYINKILLKQTLLSYPTPDTNEIFLKFHIKKKPKVNCMYLQTRLMTTGSTDDPKKTAITEAAKGAAGAGLIGSAAYGLAEVVNMMAGHTLNREIHEDNCKIEQQKIDQKERHHQDNTRIAENQQRLDDKKLKVECLMNPVCEKHYQNLWPNESQLDTSTSTSTVLSNDESSPVLTSKDVVVTTPSPSPISSPKKHPTVFDD